MIKINITKQILYHHRKTGVVCAYPVSTASRGIGNQQGSYQTPWGRHKIYRKIGANFPLNTFFVAREAKGIFTQKISKNRQDWILSRILWLDGCQTGINRRGKVDSRQRYIYIHGTNEENCIGTPASHGCIRMFNIDILDLFSHVQCGEAVFIKP